MAWKKLPTHPTPQKTSQGDVYDVIVTIRCLWTRVSDSLVGAPLWLEDSIGDSSVVELPLGRRKRNL